jgi:hypothetical protein
MMGLSLPTLTKYGRRSMAEGNLGTEGMKIGWQRSQ